jgi:hypothetical protein
VGHVSDPKGKAVGLSSSDLRTHRFSPLSCRSHVALFPLHGLTLLACAATEVDSGRMAKPANDGSRPERGYGGRSGRSGKRKASFLRSCYDDDAEPSPRPRAIHGLASFLEGTSTKRRSPRWSEIATRFRSSGRATFSTADWHRAAISTPAGRKDSEDVSLVTTEPLRPRWRGRARTATSRRQERITNRSTVRCSLRRDSPLLTEKPYLSAILEGSGRDPLELHLRRPGKAAPVAFGRERPRIGSLLRPRAAAGR